MLGKSGVATAGKGKGKAAVHPQLPNTPTANRVTKTPMTPKSKSTGKRKRSASVKEESERESAGSDAETTPEPTLGVVGGAEESPTVRRQTASRASKTPTRERIEEIIKNESSDSDESDHSVFQADDED